MSSQVSARSPDAGGVERVIPSPEGGERIQDFPKFSGDGAPGRTQNRNLLQLRDALKGQLQFRKTFAARAVNCSRP